MAGEDDFSEAETELLRFQREQELPLRAANLGFDMDRFVHQEAGKHLIEAGIDGIHACMLMLLEADLHSSAARQLQIQGLAYKHMIDLVRETLETGRTAAFELADATDFAEDEDDEENSGTT